MPTSPKLWYERYAGKLRELGWVGSPLELGIWRKASSDKSRLLKLVVYVDDNLISAPTAEEAAAEIRKIFNVFPGREIQADITGPWSQFDILGANLMYSQEFYTFRLPLDR